MGGGRVEERAGARPPRGPRLSPRRAGSAPRAWGPESRSLGGRSKWDHLLLSSEVSALCQAPIPLAPHQPPPSPVPSDSRDSKERSPRGRDGSGSVMGSDSGRRARGAGSRGPRRRGAGAGRAGRGARGPERRGPGPGGRAAPEGGSAGSHSRPGRRAPLKWPQLHTPTRR